MRKWRERGFVHEIANSPEHLVPLFAFPFAIRKMIYTTNAVKSLNRFLCKIIKTRGSFSEARTFEHALATREKRTSADMTAMLLGDARELLN